MATKAGSSPNARGAGDSLSLGAWFNGSSAWLRAGAVATALAFVALCVAIAYGVGQLFVCVGSCAPGTPSLVLIVISILLGLVPAVGTGAIGYFIARGLWEDAKQAQQEREQPENI